MNVLYHADHRHVVAADELSHRRPVAFEVQVPQPLRLCPLLFPHTPVQRDRERLAHRRTSIASAGVRVRKIVNEQGHAGQSQERAEFLCIAPRGHNDFFSRFFVGKIHQRQVRSAVCEAARVRPGGEVRRWQTSRDSVVRAAKLQIGRWAAHPPATVER